MQTVLQIETFYHYFVNVGPGLASKMLMPNEKVSVYDYLPCKNKSSMFMNPAQEGEIVNIIIVNACKSKASGDQDNIDMVIVKRVIKYIVNPIFVLNHWSMGCFQIK